MIITVDTGGTKTLVAGADAAGRFHTRYRFATPKDTADYIDQLSEVILNHFDIKKIRAISIAVPGSTEGDIVVSCKNLGWKDFDIVSHLRQALGTKAKIFVENDANLAGLSEARALLKIPRLCLYITISTGIGTGVAYQGKLIDELLYYEGGQAVIEYDGILRVWEDFASGRAIHETYGRYARDIKAKAVWEQIADKIARGILVLAPTLKPDVIVIGGSIGTYFPKYEKMLHAILDKHQPKVLQRVKIVQAKHPEEAVIYGCRIYAEQKLTE